MTAGIKANSDGSGAIQVGGSDVIGLGTTGNVNIPTSGARITGDFSNATIANRVMFQTSTVNGASDIPVIPNGTGTNARHFYFGSSDTANASLLTAGVVGTEATFRASAVGSGTSPAMTFYTGGSERLRVDTSGNVGIGTSSPTGIGGSYRSLVIVGSAGGALDLSDSSATTRATISTDNTGGNALFIDTRTSSPIVFRTGAGTTERMRIASDGVITSGLGGMQVISGTSVSASSTAVNFTGIPSWVKRITVMLSGVSTNGTSRVQVQIGSGSVQTSGYVGQSANPGGTTSTFGAGFVVSENIGAAEARQGIITISLLNSTTWVESGVVSIASTSTPTASAGTVTLSGALDRVRITTVNGTDTFDAGTINILYE